MSMELAILVWALVGAGITAGAFIVARAAVQLATVGYEVIERRLDPRTATRQTVMLTLAMLIAGGATALIAAIAILALFATLLQGAPDVNQ